MKCLSVFFDYDKFKIEVRRIEANLNDTSKKDNTHRVQSAINIDDKRDKSEMKEIKELLQTINTRVKKLEEEKERGNTGYSGYRGGRDTYNDHRGEAHGIYRGRRDDYTDHRGEANGIYRGGRGTYSGQRGGGRGSVNYPNRGSFNNSRGRYEGRGGRGEYLQRNLNDNRDTRTCFHCKEEGKKEVNETYLLYVIERMRRVFELQLTNLA